MSEKTAKIIKNEPKKRNYKWLLYVLIAIILELGAIGGAVFICESKTKNQTNLLDRTVEQLVLQNERIVTLEKMPLVISQLSSNISENKGNIGLLQENLNTLKEEVGNKKLEILSEKMNKLVQRIEGIEETKNRESLILSIALLIKENILYGRDASYEIDILSSMAQEQDSLKDSIDTITNLKNKMILTDNNLQEQFNQIIEDFDFEKKQKSPQNTKENQTTMSKSIQMIKDTVAGINFDKVVVVKKDNKTAKQKEMIATLKNLVALHNFNKAIEFVDENKEFSNAENPLFNTWLENVKNKVAFDRAISKIIATELNVLRENLRDKKLAIQPNENTETIAKE